ncbi:MAG: RNase adapter RapZ [Deltaproteobacteria bacterium]
MRFVIVTGLSGAGKSQAIKFLEDHGFFCVDNLPPALLPKFTELCSQTNNKIEKVAIVIDIRGGKLFDELFEYLSSMKEQGFSYEILFLEASDQSLIKRFKETRRSHPLSPEGRIITGIEKEKALLEGLKKRANYIIDTSNLSTRQLKEHINSIFLEGKSFEGVIITVMSFGFKYGIPIDSDLVFDVRFIPNPFYIENLKKLTGKDKLVKEYVLQFDETKEFIKKTDDMLEFLIPNYIKEGKSQLVISIGCTGGKHRSITIAEELAVILEGKGHHVVIEHRDISKDSC